MSTFSYFVLYIKKLLVYLYTENMGASFKGRTIVFKTIYVGSNPAAPAKIRVELIF